MEAWLSVMCIIQTVLMVVGFVITVNHVIVGVLVLDLKTTCFLFGLGQDTRIVQVFRPTETESKEKDVNNAAMTDSVWTPPMGPGQSHTAVSQSAAVCNKPSRLMTD